MPDRTDKADPLRSILEEASPAEPDEAAIEAALAEPVLAGIIERSMAPKVGLLTEKGRQRMRRDLAVLFLTVPRMMSVLAQARAQGASATVGNGTPGAAAQAPGARGKKKP